MAMTHGALIPASVGTAWTILLFWIAQYTLLTTQMMLMEGGRIHRSYIVDRDRVVSVRRRPTGGYVMRIDEGLELPVGRNYRAEARALADSRCRVG